MRTRVSPFMSTEDHVGVSVLAQPYELLVCSQLDAGVASGLKKCYNRVFNFQSRTDIIELANCNYDFEGGAV